MALQPGQIDFDNPFERNKLTNDWLKIMADYQQRNFGDMRKLSHADLLELKRYLTDITEFSPKLALLLAFAQDEGKQYETLQDLAIHYLRLSGTVYSDLARIDRIIAKYVH